MWATGRNFCTTGFLFVIDRRRGAFVIRQHASTLYVEATGDRWPCGHGETGAISELDVRPGDGDGGTMVVRRIGVELDTPTWDGEAVVHVLTNLSGKGAGALAVAELYRHRWGVEAASGELATCLHGEIDTLGYPKAALLGFCVASVSHNILGVVKAALRSAHGEAAVEGLSFYHLADEVAGTHRGMMIAISEDE